MLESIYNYLTELFLAMGYLGIIFLMAIESSFIPFPSEVVMIPAGFLAAQGKLNIYFVIISGIIGSVLGAYVNYYIADKFGRSFLHKNAKYLFTSEESLNKMEDFFRKHGSFATFFGRLIPIVRQYISFPAGLAKMDLYKFTLYTSLGAGIWCAILTYLGYFLGTNLSLINEYLKEISIILLIVIVVIAIMYFSITNKWYKSKFLFKK